jgi:acetyl esterase/lipase
MDIDRVNPQLREAARRAPRINVGSGAFRKLARFATHHVVRPAHVPGVQISSIRDGNLRLRLYTPRNPSGAALLWVHGGGMVIGAPRQDDLLCGETAAQLGITIASVDYRLAPEHPYPIPQQDCLAGWDWLLDNASRLNIEPARMAVGGGSAGGGIAASVVNRLHDDAGGVQPIAQWLLYPMLDDRTAANHDLDSLDHYVWNNTSNRIGWSALLRGTATPGDDNVPADAAPARRTDMSGLPPTWIGVGDIDLFHDEDADYAHRLHQAGVPVQLDIVPGGTHGLESLARNAPIVQDLLARARTWLNEATTRG